MSSNENPPEWTPPAPTPPASPGRPPQYGAPNNEAPQYGAPQSYPPAAPYPPQPNAGQPNGPQPTNGPAPYAQPPYAQPSYTQNPYAQPPYAQAPYGPAPYGPPPFAPGEPTKPRRRKGKLITAGIVVLVLVLASGGLAAKTLLNRTPALNYQGQTVDKPQTALDSAEAKVFARSQKEPTAHGPGDHCYSGVPISGKGKQRWDVSAGIYCGPMAFLDSTAGASFLHYTVHSSAAGSHVTLAPSDQPEDNATKPLPAGVTLVRPGSSHRTRSFAALAPPLAPAAAANAFVSVQEVGPMHDLLKRDGAIEMDASKGGVALENLSSVPYYDTGAKARSAAPGQKLIAFELSYEGPTDTTIRGLQVGVSVNKAAIQTLPRIDLLQEYKVISVPVKATSVELVLVDAGLRQTISLLNGALGPDNVALTQRSTQYVSTSAKHDLTFHIEDQGQTEDTGMHVTVSGVELDYFETLNGQLSTPKNPKLAFLHVDMTFTLDDSPGDTYGGIESPVIELKDKSGKVYQSTNIDTQADKVFFVYTVPATFTSGSVLFGAGVKNYDDGTSASITTPYQVDFTIPAG